MKVNFNKLEETKHMLEWFSENPYKTITSSIENMFIQQDSSTEMISFEVVSDPDWLTFGSKNDIDSKMILMRSGMAVLCNFTLKNNTGVYNLNGILSWIGINLHEKPKIQMWMDLDGTLEEFGENGALKNRINELVDHN